MFKVFEYAKVGDRVYSSIHEGGDIIKIENEKIYITFDDGFDIIVDLDGKEHEKQKNPSIEWCCYEILGRYRLQDIIFHHVVKKPYSDFDGGDIPKTLHFREQEYDDDGEPIYNYLWYAGYKSQFIGYFPIFFDDKNDGIETLVEIFNKYDVGYHSVFEALVELKWI